MQLLPVGWAPEGSERSAAYRSPSRGVRLRGHCSGQNKAVVTAGTAAAVRTVPECGVHSALARFTSSPFAEFVRSLIIMIEWRVSSVKVINRLDAPGQ